MVYTDGIHLVADSLDELHAFAQKIGLKREWFQDHPKHPHYDIFGIMYNKARKAGAKFVMDRAFIPIKRIESLDAPYEDFEID